MPVYRARSSKGIAAKLALSGVAHRLQRKFNLSTSESEAVRDAMATFIISKDASMAKKVLTDKGFGEKRAQHLTKAMVQKPSGSKAGHPKAFRGSSRSEARLAG